MPNGETLEDVYSRAIPHYEQCIVEDLRQGKNSIVAAHGNSLRALMKYLDDHDDDKVHELEIGTGEVLVYEINEDGTVVDKQVLNKGGKV